MTYRSWMSIILVFSTWLYADLATAEGYARVVDKRSSQVADMDPKGGVVLEEFVFTEAPFPSCHAATIVEFGNRLICGFFGGTAEREPDVCIWISHKVNGRWTRPAQVASGVQSASLRYPTWNPILFMPRGGDLMLFFKVGPSPSEWWGMLSRSFDGGWTWTEPKPLVDPQMRMLVGPAKNKPIQLPDGTILSPSSREDGTWRVYVEASHDNGRSWTVLAGPLNDPAKTAAIQPTLLAYPDGKIQMLCRSKEGFILQTWSSDGGKTWSAMQRTVLPNPNSGIDAVSLSDGRKLLVYNHACPDQPRMGHKGRGILNVAMTRDGKDWQASLVLEYQDDPDSQFSYPSVIQTSDGLVHIVYTWHRRRIKHVVLDPARLASVPMPDGRWPASIHP